MYFDTGEVDYDAITAHINSITNHEIDKSTIHTQVEPMVNALLSNFPILTSAEDFVWQPVLPGIGVGGSIDGYDETSGTITDYKTTGSLDTTRIPTKFPRAYYFQQMVYAWVLRKQGKPANKLQLVYITRSNTGRTSEKTGKPLKDYPSEVHYVTHIPTAEDFDFIESCIKLIAESVQFWNEHPEYHHLLAQDYRLKPKPAPILFKD